MKAAVVHEIGKPMTFEEVQVNKPDRREVLVRVSYAGVCHSDLHFSQHSTGDFFFPVPFIPGHECSGVVEAVGSEVTHVKPGDHVVSCVSVFCGCCSPCLTGYPSRCEGTDVKMPPGVAQRMSLNGKVLHQFHNVSAFAEQMLVHENAVVKIDPEMPLDRAALLGCGVLTGYGAVVHVAQIEMGATVVVIGCGGVGLSVVSAAVLAGAGRVIAIDMLDSKLELARELGATDTINAGSTDAVQAVIEMTKGGTPYAFEALGLPKTAEQAFMMLRPGGKAVVLGMFPAGQKIQLEGSYFIRDRSIMGTSMGTNRFRIDIPNLVTYYQQGKLPLDHLISDRLPLTKLNEAYATLAEGNTVRQIIDPTM